MFVKNSERESTAYFEFSYCKKKRVFVYALSHIPMRKDDSLFIHLDDEEVFFMNYGNYLENPYKQKGFNYLGPNYYTKKQTREIIEQIKQHLPLEHEILLKWLQKAVDEYEGFYFLGI